MKSALMIGVVMASMILLASPAQASVDLTSPEPSATMQLGQSATVDVVISNPDAGASPPISAHVNIIDPSGTWVDSEDWTDELVVDVDTIPAGGSRTLTWELKPISSGTFAVYAAALPRVAGFGGADFPVSKAMEVTVSQVSPIVPASTMAVSLAIPLAVGGLAVLQTRRRRRYTRERQHI